MANERKTDFFIGKLLYLAKIEYTPNGSSIKEIQDALKTASKKGTGKVGFPEFVAKSKNFIIVIEDKAEIEKQVADLAKRAQEGKITIEELTGGTFSITNGGVFGSMLSTPIINPPQSAILGIHATKPRPAVENGQIVIRPMNYVALSYDHRIIDGREAVLSLVTIKEALEYPVSPLFEN